MFAIIHEILLTSFCVKYIMVKTHKTIKNFSSQESAINYIESNYEVNGEAIEKFAVHAEGTSHSSPAISYSVNEDGVRYVHALTSGHVVVRYDRDSCRGYGPHSDQESKRNKYGHPR